ncbi:hypothetical protein L6164_005152 [Bauhinia variegata]|uniref:Uncharacterized protein n=1 Tax=Bauhinia variegata TaxID=167791 RepID=A0ACB9PQC9_BAUVA|nr:hypothetical protein L6164_005152 [Bauhinia variegata]
MVAGGVSSAIPSTRIKREDCKRTKHDSSFSDWKILIGPCDWEDYSKGKEGSARYRIHNLPEKSSAGVYELGIAVTHSRSGRKIKDLAPDEIVVVYLGQADNVRTRLQSYGRTGAHLGNTCSAHDPHDCNHASLQKGSQLFEQIFSQGYPIIYRWASMQSKEDAKQTEDQLLNVFDYAWNTINNGTRRPNDILQKLNKIASDTRRFSDMVKKFIPFTQKQVGIRIKSSMHPSDEKLCEAEEDRYHFLSRVFKFNRSRPRIVEDITDVIQENAKICGVALDDGSIRTRPPAERRMRCREHKGMRINGSIAKPESMVILKSNAYFQREGDGHGVEESPKTQETVLESFTILCGIILDDGSPCRKEPVKGRKRCVEHKGKRVQAQTSVYKSVVAGNSKFLNNAVSESNALNANSMQKTSAMYKLDKVQGQSPFSSKLCGVNLGDGFCCTREPVRGRVRCEEHKGMRVSKLISRTIAEDEKYMSDMNSHIKS